jgi:hypothetical protein
MTVEELERRWEQEVDQVIEEAEDLQNIVQNPKKPKKVSADDIKKKAEEKK